MASFTTLYPASWFDTVNDPPWFFPSGFQGGWTTDPSGSPSFAALTGYVAGTDNNYVTVQEFSPTNPVRIGMYRWVSQALTAQTISGTMNMIMGAVESDAAANFSTKIYVYVTQGATDSVRGVLLDFEDTDEWPTTAQGIAFSSAQTLSAVTTTAGDRLVIEMGLIARNAVSTNYQGTLYAGGAYGETNLTLADTAVSTHRGTFTFSHAIEIDEPAPDTGDVIASNEQLYIYDGATGDLRRIVVQSNTTAGQPDPSNGLQLSDGSWVFPTEETDAKLIFYDTAFNVTAIVDAQGTRARSLTLGVTDTIYVGFRGDNNTTPTAPTYYPRQFMSDGTFVQAFPVAIGTAGPSGIDLASDQRTLYYVCRDRVIRRYDVLTLTQLDDWVTLPTETGPTYSTAARAYGIRLLNDGGALVADLIDIKRLDSSGQIVQRYTRPNIEDWQSVTIGPGWSTFVAATIGAPDSSAIAGAGNPNVQGATGPGTALAVKFDLASGVALFELLQTVDPDTGGSQRGFTTTGGPTAGGIDVPDDFGADVADYPLRIVRRAPIVSDQEARIYMTRGQLVLQAGIGTTTGQGSNPQVMRRVSRDGGFTFGSEEWRSVGRIGQRNARVLYYLNGQARNRVEEFIVTDPAVPWTLIDYICDFTKGQN